MSNLEFTPEELTAIRTEYCAGATDTQFELFISECKARNLRPGPHVVFQLRNAKVYDPDTGTSRYVKKPYWITTIGALRLIALRTGQYGGSTPPEYIYLDENGDPAVISQIPLPSKENKSLPREPWAVRVSVKRKDFDEPITSVVRFDSVAATQKRDNVFVLTEMWQKRGDAQNAKCSEADALRKAFPEELGSLFLAEEIKNEAEDEKPRAVTPASVVPLPPSVPKVDHTPAEGKQEPRPGETKTEFHTTEVPATLPEHSGETLVTKETPKEKVLAAVPGLKTASALPPPEEKKKRGRPAKKSPDNGRDLAAEGGITDADIANAGTPPPVVDEAANLAAAQEFVASVSEFTATEAAAQGLSNPPDYSKIPEGAQKDGFIARFRELEKVNGVTNKALGDYIKSQTGKSGSKTLTVSEWTDTLAKLEAAKDDGTLKELVKGEK
jgi:hypothetical protein